MHNCHYTLVGPAHMWAAQTLVNYLRISIICIICFRTLLKYISKWLLPIVSQTYESCELHYYVVNMPQFTDNIFQDGEENRARYGSKTMIRKCCPCFDSHFKISVLSIIIFKVRLQKNQNSLYRHHPYIQNLPPIPLQTETFILMFD